MMVSIGAVLFAIAKMVLMAAVLVPLGFVVVLGFVAFVRLFFRVADEISPRN